MIDDVIVFGNNQEEHEHLAVALEKIERARLTLNKGKFSFLRIE